MRSGLERGQGREVRLGEVLECSRCGVCSSLVWRKEVGAAPARTVHDGPCVCEVVAAYCLSVSACQARVSWGCCVGNSMSVTACWVVAVC